jgi:hypothetical protein
MDMSCFRTPIGYPEALCQAHFLRHVLSNKEITRISTCSGHVGPTAGIVCIAETTVIYGPDIAVAVIASS